MKYPSILLLIILAFSCGKSSDIDAQKEESASIPDSGQYYISDCELSVNDSKALSLSPRMATISFEGMAGPEASVSLELEWLNYYIGIHLPQIALKEGLVRGSFPGEVALKNKTFYPCEITLEGRWACKEDLSLNIAFESQGEKMDLYVFGFSEAEEDAHFSETFAPEVYPVFIGKDLIINDTGEEVDLTLYVEDYYLGEAEKTYSIQPDKTLEIHVPLDDFWSHLSLTTCDYAHLEMDSRETISLVNRGEAEPSFFFSTAEISTIRHDYVTLDGAIVDQTWNVWTYRLSFALGK